MVNTARFSRNLFVVGEDEYRNICAVVTGNHPIDIIICGIQSRLQDNILSIARQYFAYDTHFCFMSALLVQLVST